MTISGEKQLLLIIIASSTACLVHARSLRDVQQPSVSNTNTFSNRVVDTTSTWKKVDSSTDSSCSPDKYQMKQFNRMYRYNAVKGFKGNIFSYALKAAEIEENHTTPMTEEDHAAIANISDHSRFQPAGMELANKVICAKILQEIDAEVSLISKTALCPWDYTCDYKADRFPNYLFKARCTTAKCSGNCGKVNNKSYNKHNMCQSHGIHVTVLQMRDNCEAWVWGQELLPIACTCTNDFMMKGGAMSV